VVFGEPGRGTIRNGSGDEMHETLAYRESVLGVLISGRGSNLQAIVAGCESRVPARVGVVISNRAEAAGLTWAAERGLVTAVIPHREYPSREDHDRAVLERLRSAGVEWVCLAGYMRILSRVLVTAYEHRILNIHPSLLPAFPGLRAQRQALEHGVKISGCTVHMVDTQLDHGPIVLQRAVRVRDDDTEATLSARILEQEHKAYANALEQLLTDSWTIDGRTVRFANHS
jgi:phosphoribosylglycinamide formyltransferase-1